MIDHLGKRLVPSGQTVLLDFLYSKLEKKPTKKKKKRLKFHFFLFTLNSLTTQISRHHHAVPLEDPSLRFRPWCPTFAPPWACCPPVRPSVHLSGEGSSRPDDAIAGRVLGQAGLIRQQVMCKDRVVPRGAGAVGVLAGRRVLLEGHREVQVLLPGRQTHQRWVPPAGDQATPPCAHRPTTLTSVDVTVRTLSRSSTSCLKVGRCEGTACQHSRMIMYLREGRGDRHPWWGLSGSHPPAHPPPNRLREQLWPTQLQPWWPWCMASWGRQEEEGFVEPRSSLPIISCVTDHLMRV